MMTTMMRGWLVWWAKCNDEKGAYGEYRRYYDCAHEWQCKGKPKKGKWRHACRFPGHGHDALQNRMERRRDILTERRTYNDKRNDKSGAHRAKSVTIGLRWCCSIVVIFQLGTNCFQFFLFKDCSGTFPVRFPNLNWCFFPFLGKSFCSVSKSLFSGFGRK